MILYRSPNGVVSSDGLSVVLRVRPALDVGRRVSERGFRAGELDAAMVEAFGAEALALAKREPCPPVGLSEQERNEIVAGVRAGAEVVVGGSRSHTAYFGRDGELIAQDFDEGMTTDAPCSESTLRLIIESYPESFLAILREPLRARLTDALLANAPDARAALGELHAFGECLARVDLLEAALAWSQEKRTTAEWDGNDAYHSVMSAIGYSTKSIAAGRFGLLVFSRLFEMTGEVRHVRRYRASFHAMAGDHAAALADLEWERAHLAKDDPDSEYLDREIETVRSDLRAAAVHE